MSTGKGIKLSTGFDLSAKAPLDNREIFKTIEERDTLPDIMLYEGLECFVEETKQYYSYIDNGWKPRPSGESSGGVAINDATDIILKDEYDKFEATNVEGALNELIDKIDNVSVEGINEIEYSNEEPTNRNISLWIDTSNMTNPTHSFSDALLLEFKNAILNLNNQIADLVEKNKELEARVTYLELNGGGGGDVPPIDITYDILFTDENRNVLTFEDGSIMLFEKEEAMAETFDTIMVNEKSEVLTFEDGSIFIFESKSTIDSSDIVLINENGDILTFEDGSIMCLDIQQIEENATNLLTFEDNSLMTFEDGSLMAFNIELSNDIILINELEEMMMFEDDNIMKF